MVPIADSATTGSPAAIASSSTRPLRLGARGEHEHVGGGVAVGQAATALEITDEAHGAANPAASAWRCRRAFAGPSPATTRTKSGRRAFSRVATSSRKPMFFSCATRPM